jgi:hypothetical protein
MPRPATTASALGAALLWLLAALHQRLVLPLVAWWEGWTDHAEESTKALIRLRGARGTPRRCAGRRAGGRAGERRGRPLATAAAGPGPGGTPWAVVRASRGSNSVPGVAVQDTTRARASGVRAPRRNQALATARPVVLTHATTRPPVRESFGLVSRALNGAGAWVLSALDASYAETQRRAWQQQQAWQTWWREDRQSTLNALIARGRTSECAALPAAVVPAVAAASPCGAAGSPQR